MTFLGKTPIRHPNTALSHGFLYRKLNSVITYEDTQSYQNRNY